MPAKRTGECTCGGESGDTNLVGSENAEKIWNYFIDKGLKPFQVAGILGNISVESGFNPRSLQPSTTGDFPVAGQGYGLVQWTDRHEDLIRRSREQNVKIYDLAFQIGHIWWELNNTENAAFENFKKTTDLESAWKVFSIEYERPAVPYNPERGKAAQVALAKYGSTSGGGGGSSSGGTSCSTSEDGSGEVTGEYSLPVPKKYYKSNPDWFTKPHHDYSAADIPVPDGTKIFSMTAGKIILAPSGGACGNGLIIDAGNGVEYGYCHGSDGGTISGAKQGDTVKPGQLIMHSDNTGSSEGTHLHLQIKVGGELKCPQKLFVGIVEGKPPKEASLPSTGCSYAT
jgi:hypothetical protein